MYRCVISAYRRGVHAQSKTNDVISLCGVLVMKHHTEPYFNPNDLGACIDCVRLAEKDT